MAFTIFLLFGLAIENRIILEIGNFGLIVLLNGFSATFSTYIPKVFGTT